MKLSRFFITFVYSLFVFAASSGAFTCEISEANKDAMSCCAPGSSCCSNESANCCVDGHEDDNPVVDHVFAEQTFLKDFSAISAVTPFVLKVDIPDLKSSDFRIEQPPPSKKVYLKYHQLILYS